MKRFSLRLIPLLLLVLFILPGCASRPMLLEEDFKAACDTAGLTAADVSAQFDPASTQTALTAATETVSTGFFVFTGAPDAKSNYAQMLSTVKTGADGEKTIDSAEYNRFSSQNGDTHTLLYRNGATLFFVTGTDKGVYDALVKALGL